jgi:hypothetical protein
LRSRLRHLERLIEFEYVLVHRGRQGQGFLYELGYAGQGRDGERFVLGLVDVGVGAGSARADADTMSTSRGKETTSRGVSGGVAGRGVRSLDEGNPANTHEEAVASSALRGVNGREHQRAGMNGASYTPSYSQPRGNGRGKTLPLDANPQ